MERVGRRECERRDSGDWKGDLEFDSKVITIHLHSGPTSKLAVSLLSLRVACTTLLSTGKMKAQSLDCIREGRIMI